jgi:hypothetical protein
MAVPVAEKEGDGAQQFVDLRGIGRHESRVLGGGGGQRPPCPEPWVGAK